jgi:hypothetical protein
MILTDQQPTFLIGKATAEIDIIAVVVIIIYHQLHSF